MRNFINKHLTIICLIGGIAYITIGLFSDFSPYFFAKISIVSVGFGFWVFAFTASPKNKKKGESEEVVTEKNPMTADDYISIRLNDQINWYSKRSKHFKNYYYAINISVAVIASLVTVFTALPTFIENTESISKITTLILSSSIPVIIAVQGVMKCQELYISYRSTCEQLKQEKILFLNKTGEYEEAHNPDKLLVRRCESIMSTETRNWTQLNENNPTK